ncbi:MAG: radical SAM protein [bacterium]|nr:radical SAM protein [bacterium]
MERMNILFIVKEVDYLDPLGLMTISAVARQQGHQASLCILNREDVFRKITEYKPRIIAYSASTGEHKYYFQINDRIKAGHKDIFTIMGGPHTTFFPFSIRECSLDAVCIGEGEEAFTELLTRMEQGKDIRNIPNILLQGEEQHPELHPINQDLDSLPFPDRELIYRNTEMSAFPLKSFMASRGCPYSCTYCFNHAFRKIYKNETDFLRRHSVDYMIEEILQVKKKYNLQFIKFYDDIFIMKVDPWLEEFVEKYRKKVGLPFHVLMRANLVHEDMVKKLKEAGCHSISISIESADDRLRNEVLKRNMTGEQMLNAFHLCKKYGIHTFANNILGLPTSTI